MRVGPSSLEQFLKREWREYPSLKVEKDSDQECARHRGGSCSVSSLICSEVSSCESSTIVMEKTRKFL